MNSFIKELKRRNVFRVAVAYVVISWLLVQVLSLAADAFEAPVWVMKMFISLLVIAFIPTILFSWAYEITPEGIKKEKEVSRSDSITSMTAKKLDIVTLVAVLGIVGLFGYQQLVPNQQINSENQQTAIAELNQQPTHGKSTVNSPIKRASIAVLPFVDLSPNKDQEYFSDGIAEEILNVLLKVDNLSVASRTSAFGFKGQESLGIPTIAQKLNVRHILEGSVRKSGNNIRITAQLIDAKTDTHLWSQNFDRALTTENIFAIQDEIAAVIVNQLGLIINGETYGSTVKVTTQNLEAYENYLKAIRLFHVRSGKTVPIIAELLEQATELDPNFAEAWANLSAVYLVFPGWNLGSTEEYYPKVLAAANRATELDEALALPYSARASVLVGQGKIIEGMQSYSKALLYNPNDLQTIYFSAAELFDLGYIEEAKKGFERCLEVDPKYDICRRFLSFTLLFTGETEKAERLFNEGLLVGQKSYRGLFLEYYANTKQLDKLDRLFSIIRSETEQSQFTDSALDLQRRLLIDDEYLLIQHNQDLKDLLIKHDRLERAESIPVTAEEIFTVEPLLKSDALFIAEFLWSPYLTPLHKPDMKKHYHIFRKEFMLRKGYVDYWRAKGFPPQCRPIGEGDFECDLLSVSP